jgi:hypothetical protein
MVLLLLLLLGLWRDKVLASHRKKSMWLECGSNFAQLQKFNLFPTTCTPPSPLIHIRSVRITLNFPSTTFFRPLPWKAAYYMAVVPADGKSTCDIATLKSLMPNPLYSWSRNIYAVSIPQSSTEQAQVLFDNSSKNRKLICFLILGLIKTGRLQASPFTAWLRVPFSWFQSSTIAFFPDETHQSIRRNFVSPFDSNTRHQFCGYCGTQLSHWGHNTQEEENFISLTLGSLLEDDLERLEELGLLEPDSSSTVFKPAQASENRGAQWFESMIEDSPLRKQKRRQVFTEFEVEWEIIEWTSDVDQTTTAEAAEAATTKRKIGEVEGEGENEDIEMQNR